MKAVVAAFNQEKALVGAFSVIVQPVVEPMDRFAALFITSLQPSQQIQLRLQQGCFELFNCAKRNPLKRSESVEKIKSCYNIYTMWAFLFKRLLFVNILKIKMSILLVKNRDIQFFLVRFNLNECPHFHHPSKCSVLRHS